MQKILFFLLSITNMLSIIAMETKEEEFFNAIKTDNLAKVKELIGDINIDMQDKDGNTPLMLSVAKSDPNNDIVAAILNEIPNTSLENKNKKNAIQLTVGIKKNKGVIMDNIRATGNQYALYEQMIIDPANQSAVNTILKTIPTITNSPNPRRNLLALAINKKNKDMVKELIKKGADVNQVLRDGKTPLDIAKEVGAADIAQLLINAGAKEKPASSSIPTELKSTDDYFFDAVKDNNNTYAEYLLNQGAVRSNVQDKDGNTALMIAVGKNNIGLIDILLKLDADIALKNKRGDSALGLAINAGNLPIVKILLSKSKKLNIDAPVDQDNNTALILAIKGNNKDIIDAILLQGPNPSLKNTNNETAATFAKDDQMRESLLAQAQEQYNLYKAIYDGVPLPEIEKLITANVTLRIADPNKNPLVIALYRPDAIELINLLMQKKKDIAAINLILRDGKTPLIIAIEDSIAPNTVKALLENGADPELAGSDGRTPLVVATGNTEIIKILEEAIRKKAISVTPPVDDKLLLSSLHKLGQSLRALHMKLTVK